MLLIAYAFAYKHHVRSHGFTRFTRGVYGRLRVSMQHSFTLAREIILYQVDLTDN